MRTASNRSHLEKSIAALKLNKGIKRTHTKANTLDQLLEIAGVTSLDSRKASKKATKAKPVVRAKKKTTTVKPAAKKQTVR